MKILTLCSGGLDSTVLVYCLKFRYKFDVGLLHLNYGQRHYKEEDSFWQLSYKLAIPAFRVDLGSWGQLLRGSALTDITVEVPDGHYADESMSVTVVPARNAVFTAIAASVAAANGYDGIAIAVHSGDHPIYPDCRHEFVRSMRGTLKLALDLPDFRLFAPFIFLTKSDIVKIGALHQVPFKETWSCYKGREIHCGTCGTCVERKEAFKLAQVKDPTEYEA